jgi:hypothetical protein
MLHSATERRKEFLERCSSQGVGLLEHRSKGGAAQVYTWMMSWGRGERHQRTQAERDCLTFPSVAAGEELLGQRAGCLAVFLQAGIGAASRVGLLGVIIVFLSHGTGVAEDRGGGGEVGGVAPGPGGDERMAKVVWPEGVAEALGGGAADDTLDAALAERRAALPHPEEVMFAAGQEFGAFDGEVAVERLSLSTQSDVFLADFDHGM